MKAWWIAGFALLVFFCAGLYGQDKAPQPGVNDPWQRLRFLVATWEAKTQGGSAQATGSGSYTFQLELGNHVLARHTTYEGCSGPADFNCQHSDLFYVYENPGPTLKAIYFDNEGHVIHYDVSTPVPNAAVFTSSSSQPGPQFRLSYELKGQTMHGAFQMRMPGQSEFKSYLEWSGEKK